VCDVYSCCVFMDVCFVLFLFCLFTCVCVCHEVHGPLLECLQARRCRATLLLHTTFVRSWCTWRASCVAAYPKKTNPLVLQNGELTLGHEPQVCSKICFTKTEQKNQWVPRLLFKNVIFSATPILLCVHVVSVLLKLWWRWTNNFPHSCVYITKVRLHNRRVHVRAVSVFLKVCCHTPLALCKKKERKCTYLFFFLMFLC